VTPLRWAVDRRHHLTGLAVLAWIAALAVL
jgi:hypothetical protein